MATVARRGAMLHHHVPEPKGTPPLVHRLRMELNRTVRRRVTEAVDAVCVAFENDLTQLTATVVGVENYDVFYACCSRLTKFIDKNMDTTPGFLQQMDRLILACHSGTAGTLLHSAMTKDLRIRRRDEGKNDVEEELEPLVTMESEQMASSLAKTAITRKMRRVMKGEESGRIQEEQETIETTPRQWGTRKRLSTTDSSMRKLKKVKRTLVTEKRRNSDKSEEDKQRNEKEKGSVSIRTSARHARAAKRTSRQMKCARQLENMLGKRRGRSAQIPQPHLRSSTEAIGHELGKELRWNLRGLTKDGSMSNAVDGGEGPNPKRSGEQFPQSERLECSEESDAGGIEQIVEMASEADSHVSTTHVEAAGSVAVNECEQVDTGMKETFQATASECDVEMATTSNDHSEAETEGKSSTDDCSSTELNKDCQERKNKTNSSSEKADDLDEVAKVRDEPVDNATSLSDIEIVGGEDRHEVDNEEGVRELKIDHKGQDDTSCQLLPSTDLEAPEHREAAGAHPEQPLVETSSLPNEEESYAELDQEEPSESEDESPIPGFCDAGMRPRQQVIHFKTCLRKSIRFVDAVLCKPPLGKICIRNCHKIRARQCREGVACRDSLCRNWHQTEAHTERCKNPLCEFGTRVLLREIMHQIANQETQIQMLCSQREAKCTDSSNKQYTEDELSKLQGETDVLEQQIKDEREENESLKDTRRILLANLSAIGVSPSDDVADGFPDYGSHYK